MKEYSAYQQTESYKQFMKLKYTGIAEDEKISIMICLIVLHLRLELNHDLLTIVFFVSKWSGKGTAVGETKKGSHKSHKESKTEPPKSQVSGSSH